MMRRLLWACVFTLMVFGAVYHAPAPLVYTPGEGWTYESPGKVGRWQRARAKDQLEVAEDAFRNRDYSLALRAARRVLVRWPMSDYAPAAQFLIAQCYEARRNDERAFKEYQRFLDRYPKSELRETALRKQAEIAERFLRGQRFKLFGYIPLFPSMSRTAELFQGIVTNAVFSDIGAMAQLKAGEAYEKRGEYDTAARLYELAADRYNTRREIAAEAMYCAGQAYRKLAKKAEYDRSAAERAINTLSDFVTLYPDDPRVSEALKVVAELRAEQARGSLEIARYYQKHGRRQAALIYYADVIQKAPGSDHAKEALRKIAEIQGGK